MDDAIELTPLEADFIGDLDRDYHALHEVFEFVKLHHPDSSQAEALRLGRALVVSWINRGWLAAIPNRDAAPASDQSLAPITYIDAHGEAAMTATATEPWLTLTDRAYLDVPWLKCL